jgi:hypothetical protein
VQRASQEAESLLGVTGEFMSNWKLLCLAALLLAACGSGHAERAISAQLVNPTPSESHPYAGFWKDDGHCDEDFGLSIAPAGPGMYSVSFCGPGGCFEPGTYRPNTPLVGDTNYQLIDQNTIGVGVNGGGYQRYVRCPVTPNNSSKPTPLRGAA